MTLLTQINCKTLYDYCLYRSSLDMMIPKITMISKFPMIIVDTGHIKGTKLGIMVENRGVNSFCVDGCAGFSMVTDLRCVIAKGLSKQGSATTGLTLW